MIIEIVLYFALIAYFISYCYFKQKINSLQVKYKVVCQSLETKRERIKQSEKKEEVTDVIIEVPEVAPSGYVGLCPNCMNKPNTTQAQKETDRASVSLVGPLVRANQNRNLESGERNLSNITQIVEYFIFNEDNVRNLHEQKIKSWLLNTRSSLYVCVYKFTYKGFSDLFETIIKGGVDVKVIIACEEGDNFLNTFNSRQNVIENLKKYCVPLKTLYINERMHHKFAIRDKKQVMTGSLNWTYSALHRNHENVIIFEDQIACNSFVEQFNILWQRAVLIRSDK